MISGVPQTASPLVGIYSSERNNPGMRLLVRMQLCYGGVLIGGMAAAIILAPGLICTLFGLTQTAQAVWALRLFALSLPMAMLCSICLLYTSTFETPAHAGRTLKSLWRFVNDQHKRLTIVLVSVVFYTFLSIIAPAYSAHIVDLLWNGIKAAITDGTAFRVTWADGGRDIFYLLLIYLATALFYTLQAYLMLSLIHI